MCFEKIHMGHVGEKKYFLEILIYYREREIRLIVGEGVLHRIPRIYVSTFPRKKFSFRGENTPLSFPHIAKRYIFLWEKGERERETVSRCGEGCVSVYFRKHLRNKDCVDGGLELPTETLIKGIPFTLASYIRYPFYELLISIHAYVFF